MEKRNLSIKGKIIVVKTFVLSQFSYLANMCIISDNLLNNLEREIFKFVWNSKTERIKRQTIISSYNEGGLNMTDI